MQVLLHNIGGGFSGKLEAPTLDAKAVVIEDGIITGFEESKADRPDMIIDCNGMTIAPGLVDTHIHPTIGDYGTKQQAVGYLQQMVHGAVTRVMSAGEVHTPGRNDAESALAIAHGAFCSYRNYRPLGIKVHGGAMMLEKDTTCEHIDRAYEVGMRIIGEFGIGSLKDPVKAHDLCKHARGLGMTVHMHCGCTSDRGPGGDEHPYFGADDVLTVCPSIASHVNQFASLSDEDIDRLCTEDGAPPHVEIVAAGGTRSMIRVVDRLTERNELHRLLIGTDTPTGFGITPLGMLKTIGDICSLGGVDPAVAWAIGSGQNAKAFGVDGNTIGIGQAADIVVIDASIGSTNETATQAIAAGEWAGVAAVLTDGQLQVNGSQCSLRANRKIAVTETH